MGEEERNEETPKNDKPEPTPPPNEGELHTYVEEPDVEITPEPDEGETMTRAEE